MIGEVLSDPSILFGDLLAELWVLSLFILPCLPVHRFQEAINLCNDSCCIEVGAIAEVPNVVEGGAVIVRFVDPARIANVARETVANPVVNENARVVSCVLKLDRSHDSRPQYELLVVE